MSTTDLRMAVSRYEAKQERLEKVLAFLEKINPTGKDAFFNGSLPDVRLAFGRGDVKEVIEIPVEMVHPILSAEAQKLEAEIDAFLEWAKTSKHAMPEI